MNLTQSLIIVGLLCSALDNNVYAMLTPEAGDQSKARRPSVFATLEAFKFPTEEPTQQRRLSIMPETQAKNFATIQHDHVALLKEFCRELRLKILSLEALFNAILFLKEPSS